jgi:menaquinone-dependent protoporphyrinogen oxidase
MKTLILYATKYGSVEKVAKLIAEKIPNCVLHNIKRDKNVDMKDFERVVIGGSIYIGKIQKQISRFCSENLAALLQKEVGLFICAMNKEDKQLQASFPDELLKHCKASANFGGEFQFEKMNVIEKAIVKKIANISKSVSNLDYQAIDEFCNKLLARKNYV